MSTLLVPIKLHETQPRLRKKRREKRRNLHHWNKQNSRLCDDVVDSNDYFGFLASLSSRLTRCLPSSYFIIYSPKKSYFSHHEFFSETFMPRKKSSSFVCVCPLVKFPFYNFSMVMNISKGSKLLREMNKI